MLLGRAAGLTEQKLAHLGDDPLPDDVYEPDEAAIVRYAQRSTRLDKIDADTYNELARLFDTQQIIEICFTVGVSNMINRFHATFSTELDPIIRAAVGDACPLAYPEPPA